jgi:hypothetical protein
MAGHTRQAGVQSLFSITNTGRATLTARDQDGTGHHPAPQYPHPGLVAGSVVWTADGAIPVEFLAPGDRIVTRDAGLVAVAALHFVQYRGDFIEIAAHSLGQSRPDTDTITPATQTVLLRGQIARRLTGQDSAVLPASQLDQIPGVTRRVMIEMTLVQLIFDHPHLVYADGLETVCASKGCIQRAA